MKMERLLLLRLYSCSTEAYKADDFIEVEEHSHVPLSTADEPKSIPQGCYYSLQGDLGGGGGGGEGGDN